MKYVISEEKALQLRDFVQAYLCLDERGCAAPKLSYPVHTIYLDAPDLRLYQGMVIGHRNRTQLRLRYYDQNDDTPVYAEIKRWAGNQIIKERGAVRRTAVSRLLQGELPGAGDLTEFSPRAFTAVGDFVRLLQQINAIPVVHVGYLREGYANDLGSVRLNLDRQILAQRQAGLESTGTLTGTQSPASPCLGKGVMLELKFIGRFPNWFCDLVEHFDLEEFDTAKYLAAMQAVGLAPP